MHKMDKTWITVATLIYPETSSTKCVSPKEVASKMNSMFNEKINYTLLGGHLVSTKDRMYSKSNPSIGGSRNRYFFKTFDGKTPDSKEKVRLYKKKNRMYDGLDKTGKTCPNMDDIDPKFYYLVEWHKSHYIDAE